MEPLHHQCCTQVNLWALCGDRLKSHWVECITVNLDCILILYNLFLTPIQELFQVRQLEFFSLLFAQSLRIKLAPPQAAWLSIFLSENQQCCSLVRGLIKDTLPIGLSEIKGIRAEVKQVS